MASNNPYGLSQPELNWFHGRGSTFTPSLQQVQAELDAAKTRIDKLQTLLQTGVEEEEVRSIDNNKLGLSEPERQWAMGGPVSDEPLRKQLASQKQEAERLQRQLQALEEEPN